jgi:glutaredoxin
VQLEPQSAPAARFLARAEELERSWKPIEIREGRRGRRAQARREPRSWDGPPLVANSAPTAAPRSWTTSNASSPSGRVVLYGTSWCGVCAQARAWLAKKGIAFDDLDIDKDRQAANDLLSKERSAGIVHRGVPVIEVNGRLLRPGFSPMEIQRALRAN